MDRQPAVSIVIRAKDEAACLGQTLTAVYQQRFRDFEVIVVDSGSTDGTLEIARQFPVRIIEIRPEEFTYGKSLNIGCAAARGEFLVFLSAHAIPLTDEWLSGLLVHLNDPKVAGVWGGETKHRDVAPAFRIVRQALSDYLSDIYFGLCNFNAAIRRRLWQDFHFDEKLPFAEDKEWGYRVLQAGYELVHDSSSYVLHFHRQNLRMTWRRSRTEHAGLGHFLELPQLTLLETIRIIYWEGTVICRSAYSKKSALRALWTELPHFTAQSFGRYCGLRAAYRQRRQLASAVRGLRSGHISN